MIMRNEKERRLRRDVDHFDVCCMVVHLYVTFYIRRYACCLGYDTTRRLI